MLTEHNQEKKDLLFNKLKFPETTHSSLHMRKKNLHNKLNSLNNTINKYKKLIDEFNPENKNKKKQLKKVFYELETEYFSSINPKFTEKLKLKNRNKNSFLMNNPYQNYSFAKAKTLNNMSIKINKNNIINSNNNNTLNPNYSNNVEDNNKIKKKYVILNNNKKKLSDNNGNTKNRLIQPNKYIKSNLKIDINAINNKVKNSNVLSILSSNKLKTKTNNNSLYKKKFTNFFKTTKNSVNKKTKNPFSKNVSLSPDRSNNNIKNIDGNKKIINININNVLKILKINKKYSINLTKSNESSKHSMNLNNNTEPSEQKNIFGVKNYDNSYPLFNDKNNKYKGAIIKNYNNNCKKKNPIVKNDFNNNRNYSSMLKKQLFEDKIIIS